MLFKDNDVGKTVFQLFGLFVFIISLCVLNTNAQNDKTDKIIFHDCEVSKATLADIGNDFHKNAKPDSYLVIIGGAMKGEKSSYNLRRMQQSIGYLNFATGVKDNQIVFGVGKSEAEFGYLRLYTNGILSIEIRTRKNAKLCWGEGDAMDFKVK